MVIEEIECHSAIHGARVDITVAENTCNLFCGCTFAACRISINCDNKLLQVHQQSFNGQGMGLPGFNLFFLLCWVDAHPSAMRMMTANIRMMSDLNRDFMGVGLPVKVKKRT